MDQCIVAAATGSGHPVDAVQISGPPTGSNIAAAPVDHLQLPLPLVARQESDARHWLRAYPSLLNEQYRISTGRDPPASLLAQKSAGLPSLVKSLCGWHAAQHVPTALDEN